MPGRRLRRHSSVGYVERRVRCVGRLRRAAVRAGMRAPPQPAAHRLEKIRAMPARRDIAEIRLCKIAPRLPPPPRIEACGARARHAGADRIAD
ncbi:hypothetical protein [Burkholderia savannae]|uniref:hypothetical protein n=1 Tax=Burkholderia TaxID=32008 RepID=UPI00075C0D55|nr:hypothetical protein WS78_30250 [Burkholderia savannae]KVG44830.1 hypothetical protein WS77_06500 [Burkholderia sp. MSMB0265]KVG79680.1 hypothetical protein WS81_14655 [Burkholderia sp. MSMB2040]KVG95955.1 hypothetical protein WS82_01910 [Burkholderia sp. MSMB2041]